jgi:DMSO/TMAO reductase YedYZ molybdopterin-dependent catalytic subunit
MTRRRALGLMAGAGVLVTAGRTALAEPAGAVPGRPRLPATTGDPGLAGRPMQTAPGIVKPLPPELFVVRGTNAEMRWDALTSEDTVVPNDRFFVRNHTATPAIDPATWRLRVTGNAVRWPLELTYDELRALPARTATAVIECAGNGRSFFAAQQGQAVSGTGWQLGAVGAARWRGVPLSVLLHRAGLRRSAVDVLPEGLDAPVTGGGVDQGHVRRPLPIDKALDDVLVAYEMNGEPLPADHGFPARLVVPGWVGIASIKWLGSIEVADQPLTSPWNTTSYRMVGPDYPPDSAPLTSQPVKSAFELPWPAEVAAGRRTTLTGRSWSGDARIRRVEVSTDAGATWHRAHLHPGDAGRPWARWSLPWTPPAAGSYELIARATDRAGATQPDAVPYNGLGYQFWAVVRHPVVAV